ncbi:MAG: xanthine dehydrogenase family protein molybdopterin-binding subunit [Chloroflexota bacterium]|nr:xanthine dehydrogenase family protein molybdopterin-binding subunit [Chloroflexota bacterium]
MVSTDQEYKVIGSRPVRPDGADKVTGRAEYGGDVRLPRMLYGRVKRSPHAHARIISIDGSKAMELDGVKAVITNADFPRVDGDMVDLGETFAPFKWVRDNVLASDKVLYAGHAVAAVCATDQHIAEDALDLIEVEYEVLDPVLNVHQAMADGAPQLHDYMHTTEMAARFVPGDERSEDASNIASHLRFDVGDIDAGFAEADIILEREFETSMAHQGYIEYHNGTAFWNQDGEVTVWCSSQAPFSIRESVAALLDLPVSKVKVIPMEIGGGFGGKISVYMEPMAAIMSRMTGQPVKMLMTREEVLTATGPTSATYVRCKIGAKRDGTLVAVEAELAYEAGAFPGSPVAAGAGCMFGSYDIPNQRTDAYDVVTNKPKVAAYRAPGSPQGTFAMESLMTELAERLEMDEMELRLKNASAEGVRRTDGVQHGRIGAEEVMKAAQETPHYRSELTGKNRGRGISMGYWGNAGLESSAYALVSADGDVSLVLGSVDIGGQRAALAMQLAEALGITYENVHPRVVDTDSIGFTHVTGGSRTTFATGWAVYEAAMDIRRQFEERAATIWEVDRDAVSYGEDGVVRGPADDDGNERSFTFAELSAQLPLTGGLIQGHADVLPTGVGAAFGCHIVDVEVDPETGKVDVLRYTAVQDVGKAIHPSYVEGQIQGGAAQGVGMALTEEYFYRDDGAMANSSLLDYRMPTALDLPEIETVLVEVPNPGHPYGVRGVGEVPIVPPLAAIGNAIHDATDVRVTQLPASPRWLLDQFEDGQE